MDVRPDGTVVYCWGSVTSPWQYFAVGKKEPLFTVNSDEPSDVQVLEEFVDRPDGSPIPITRIEPKNAEPGKVFYSLHRGKGFRSANEPLNPVEKQALAEGWQVVSINYAGSDGMAPLYAKEKKKVAAHVEWAKKRKMLKIFTL